MSGPHQFPGHSSCPTAGKSGFCEGPFYCLCSINKLSCKPVSFRLHRPTSTGTSKSSSPYAKWMERAILVQAKLRRCPAIVSNTPRPTEPLWPFHQLSGSINLLQMVHGCFLSHKEMDNAGALASLAIPLTCRRKIPSLLKHSKPNSPDAGRVQSVESLKPVTSCLYGFTSEIAPGLNGAKEL